jgi:hypothetical protein
MKTIQLLGSTTLTRVALPWFMERAGARVVAVDPGDEDEARPWFAPVRGLCREIGVPIGRLPADFVIDLDPDARRTGPGVRLCGPLGVTPDFCRAILPRGAGRDGWRMLYGDGDALWSAADVDVLADDDGTRLRDRATLRGIEALAAGWDPDVAKHRPGDPLHPPFAPGRFRTSEAQIIWQQPAVDILARIRALGGPFGGARTHVGDTPLAIESAELSADPGDSFSPGTIVDVDHGVVIACGTGAVRILTLRPSWRPLRNAAEFAREVGASTGYQLC